MSKGKAKGLFSKRANISLIPLESVVLIYLYNMAVSTVTTGNKFLEHE